MHFVISVYAESWDTAGMTVLNWGLFRETDLKPITCTVREHQLRLFWHVPRHPNVDLISELFQLKAVLSGGGQGTPTEFVD